MRISAWLIRSELTTAPMVVRLFWATIGPSSSSRAVRTSPRGPVSGSSIVPAGAADGDAEGEGLPDGLADGLAEGAADGLADGPRPDGLAEASSAGAGARGRRGRGARATRTASADGRASVGTGVACGACGWRPTGRTVRISMKPEPVVSAVASRPCSAKTASTWSGVTVGSSNLISQRVPPV